MGARISHPSASWYARSAVAIAALLGIAVPLQSQTAPPAFEVASVKLSPPDAGYTTTSPWGTDGFTATNASLQYLIEIAYGVQQNQIAGGPGWLGSQPYDVAAKSEGGQKLSYEQVQAPLRQLLEQRFHLTTHREKKNLSGYALVVAKGGAKLQTNKGAPQLAYILENGIHIQNASVATLASMLASPTKQPVIDKTGIEGSYDIKLDYAPDGAANSSLPSLYTALQEQLGLKLEPQKVPVEMLVIDHVDKIPTEN